MRSRTTTVDSSALSDVSAVAGRDVDLERDPGDAGDQQPNMRAQTNFMPELFVPLVCGIPPVSFVITRRPGWGDRWCGSCRRRLPSFLDGRTSRIRQKLGSWFLERDFSLDLWNVWFSVNFILSGYLHICNYAIAAVFLDSPASYFIFSFTSGLVLVAYSYATAFLLSRWLESRSFASRILLEELAIFGPRLGTMALLIEHARLKGYTFVQISHGDSVYLYSQHCYSGGLRSPWLLGLDTCCFSCFISISGNRGNSEDIALLATGRVGMGNGRT